MWMVRCNDCENDFPALTTGFTLGYAKSGDGMVLCNRCFISWEPHLVGFEQISARLIEKACGGEPPWMFTHEENLVEIVKGQLRWYEDDEDPAPPEQGLTTSTSPLAE